MTNLRPAPLAICGLVFSVAAAVTAVNADDTAPASYMRIARPTDTAARLEVALRRFERAEGNGPAIWLAGVIHIGEPAYYRTLQRFLDEQAVVLYEGVGVPSFADTSEADHATRARRTRDGIAFISGLAEGYHDRHGAYPLSLALLREEVGQSQPRAARWVGRALRDGWDEPLQYKRHADGYVLVSHGADKDAGGEGDNADITSANVEPIDTEALESPGIQNALADGLGLVFQLDAIDYDRDTFIPCDMSIDQLTAALRGEAAGDKELKGLMQTMSGESILTGLMRFAAALLQANPQWQEMIKLMMIEMVGSLEGDLADSPALPPRMRHLMRVLIRDRNDIVIKALASTIAAEGPPASVAVFYGAGHMADLEKRIVEELGYKPAQDVWVPAFGADAAKAGMTEQEMLMVRRLIQAQMKQLRPAP